MVQNNVVGSVKVCREKYRHTAQRHLAQTGVEGRESGRLSRGHLKSFLKDNQKSTRKGKVDAGLSRGKCMNKRRHQINEKVRHEQRTAKSSEQLEH